MHNGECKLIGLKDHNRDAACYTMIIISSDSFRSAPVLGADESCFGMCALQVSVFKR